MTVISPTYNTGGIDCDLSAKSSIILMLVSHCLKCFIKTLLHCTCSCSTCANAIIVTIVLVTY